MTSVWVSVLWGDLPWDGYQYCGGDLPRYGYQYCGVIYLGMGISIVGVIYLGVGMGGLILVIYLGVDTL